VAGFDRAKIKAQIEKSGKERRTRLRSNGVYAFPKKQRESSSLRRAAWLNAILAQLAEDKAF
jgi:hypothetical protein